MPLPLEVVLLAIALVLTAAALIESPRNVLGWAVLVLVLLALFPHVG